MRPRIDLPVIAVVISILLIGAFVGTVWHARSVHASAPGPTMAVPHIHGPGGHTHSAGEHGDGHGH